jgi:hypothetical protein
MPLDTYSRVSDLIGNDRLEEEILQRDALGDVLEGKLRRLTRCQTLALYDAAERYGRLVEAGELERPATRAASLKHRLWGLGFRIKE